MGNKDYIKCGDCLELMKELETNSVDVSFTSPPYNDVGGDNQDVSSGDPNDSHKKYLYVETRSDWFEWQCEVIDEMLRVTKKWVLYNIQAIKNNRNNVYKLIGKYADRIHDIVIWNKPSFTPTGTKGSISNAYEFLILLRCDGVKKVSVNSDFYKNVITCGKPINQYSKVHRAVMSMDFCDEVVKEFSSVGDIILDPFSGVGTTAISCIKQKRHYIGFEINETYYDISLERIEEALTGKVAYKGKKIQNIGQMTIFDYEVKV